AGNNEERVYTMGIAGTPHGTFLPLEQVLSGATAAPLPKANAEGYQDAVNRGFHFTFAASKKRTSHLSTLKTTCKLLLHIFKSYIDEVI
ncbi:hypothetical protein DFH06DRAFT_929430, partial [Mycena polygramma]